MGSSAFAFLYFMNDLLGGDGMGTKEIEELNKQRKQEALEEEMRKKRAEDNAEKKFDRVYQAFLVLLGVVIGSLLEHFGGIVDIVIKLLHG